MDLNATLQIVGVAIGISYRKQVYALEWLNDSLFLSTETPRCTWTFVNEVRNFRAEPRDTVAHRVALKTQ